MDSSLIIKDETTVSLRLQISGAANNNLADPNQGICGVRVKFEHRFVGDLTMELISPSGQRIKLTGPLGNSGRSDFTKWFITFVPCASLAVPDLGFKPKWDNIQSWGILGKFYNGTYYPFQGCLEDINVGPVNGTWTLSITDAERFYEGKVESFCLLFCDQTGISCVDCSPNGGLFGIEAKSFCEGNPGLNLPDKIQFPFFTPDAGLYGYKYLWIRNDTILSIQDHTDFRNWPQGKYLLCGISYLLQDSLKLPLPGTVYSNYRADLISNVLSMCAELSKNCMEIDIAPVYSGSVHKIFLCRGDSLLINGVKYDLTGIYPILLKTNYGCDSLVTLDLEIVDLQISSILVDTINCSRPVVNIDLQSSVITSKANIQWSTNGGLIVDSTDLLNIKVNKEGTYKIVVSDGSCIDSAEFVVIKDGRIPELMVLNDTIRCNKPNAQLIARTDAANPNFRWSNGVADIGIDSILLVSQAGQYLVTVTDQNGCSNYSAVVVITDTIKADIQLFATNITCKQDEAFLTFIQDKPGIVKFWQEGNTNLGNQDSIHVKKAGWIQLHYQAENGCLTVDSIQVTSNVSIPDYSYIPDTINCLNGKMFTLQDRTTAAVDSIIYTSPTGIIKKQLNPLIDEPGRYFVKLTDTAGCILDTFIEVISDTLSPIFSLKSDTLNCMRDSVMLAVNHFTDTTGLHYNWSGPVGFSGDTRQVFTREAGIYYLTVTAANGCMHVDSVSVVQDDSKPDISTSVSGKLNCAIDQVQLFGSSSTGIRYDWTGPGTFISTFQNPLVDDDGLYKLVVTAANGCTSEKTIFVERDTQSPILQILFDTINCKLDSVNLELIPGGILDSVHWSGPGLFQSNRSQNFIAIGGRYRVFAKGTNHCIDSMDVMVPVDTNAPVLSLFTDTISCMTLEGEIGVLMIESGASYLWKFPSGDSLYGDVIRIQQPGVYFVKATGANGCSYTDSVLVSDFTNAPVLTTVNDTITCADTLAQIGLMSSETGLNYSWMGPGNFTSMDSACQVSSPGWYYYQATNSYGCITTDSLFVYEIDNKYNIQYSNPDFNCSNYSNASLSASNTDSLISYSWMFPNGLVFQDSLVVPDRGGAYIFSGIDIYGCRVRDTVVVTFDTLAPVILGFSIQALNCTRKVSNPSLIVGGANHQIRWITPDSDTIYNASPGFTASGVYQLRLTGDNFCFLDTLVNLLIDTSKPVIHVTGDTLTCEFSRAQLKLSSADSLSDVIWTGPGNVIYTENSPQVIDTGWYFVRAIGVNGCETVDSAYIFSDLAVPKLQVSDIFIPCNLDSVALDVFTNDSIETYNWFGPGNFFSNLKNPFVKDTGTYEIILIAKNKCASRDSLKVIFKRDLPEFLVSHTDLNCKNPKAELQAVCDTTHIDFQWTGPNLLDSLNLILNVDQPGVYKFSALNEFGCQHDTLVIVNIDTLHPHAALVVIDSIICEKKEAQLTVLGAIAGAEIQWKDGTGVLPGTQNSDTILINASGDYHCIVTNPVNGCRDSASIRVQEIFPHLGPMTIISEPPSCFGFNDGWILISNVGGELDPYEFSLNGSPFERDSFYRDLGAGNYQIFTRGKFGCGLDTLIRLIEPNPLSVYAGRDTTLKIGSSIHLIPTTNANPNALQKIEWFPEDFLDCKDCFDVNVKPLKTILYKISITDENGCEAEDEIRIDVIVDPQIYIPNVFSPNGDQINDFIIFSAGPEIESIRFFNIFDRWGNLVYEIKNVVPGISELFWDGTFKGQKMNPGVYVYSLEAVLTGGKTYKKQGDITLLR